MKSVARMGNLRTYLPSRRLVAHSRRFVGMERTALVVEAVPRLRIVVYLALYGRRTFRATFIAGTYVGPGFRSRLSPGGA